jgi:ISXO2-like transposase domain
MDSIFVIPGRALARTRNLALIISGFRVRSRGLAPRLRRAEIGIHHHVAGPYLSAYASEMAWRENNRRVSNGEQYLMTTSAALAHPVLRQWKGYWQR